MKKNPVCPKCKMPLVEFTGPKKPRVGLVVYQPDGNRFLDPQGDRLLANECHRVGLNSLEMQPITLWGHAEGNEAEFEWHLRRAIRKLQGCQVALLFGTDVTKVLLDKGISAIIGLEQTSPFLPGLVLFPVPHPGHTVVKPLGEFRLCLERVSQKLKQL